MLFAEVGKAISAWPLGLVELGELPAEPDESELEPPIARLLVLTGVGCLTVSVR